MCGRGGRSPLLTPCPPRRFLIDRNGNVVDRFGSMTTPAEIDAAVAKLL